MSKNLFFYERRVKIKLAKAGKLTYPLIHTLSTVWGIIAWYIDKWHDTIIVTQLENHNLYE